MMIIPKQYKQILLALFFSLIGGFSSLQAKVLLPAFIGDNMVLQQKEKVKIWGTSSALGKDLQVKTSWNKKSYSAQIDQQVNWVVYLQTPQYGGPYQISIDDGDQLTLNNILIGEVWFCSGQSNMEMPLAGWGEIDNFQQEIKAANYANIRILQIPKATAMQPTTEVKVEAGGWNSVTPQSIPTFSATAYFFAREIYEKTGIPIGLIHSSWGGTIIEAWMSRRALAPFAEYTTKIEKMQHPDPQDKMYKSLTEGPNRPTVLYNAMVKPFVDFKIKGAIWYQGESNADSKDAPYQQLLPALIKDWRQQWNNEKMPFYFVQLANYKEKKTSPQPSSWARLREAQRQTLRLPYTGMAVIADIGDAEDIHPKNKQDVGKRLGWIATNQLYGKKIPYSGPVLADWTIKGNEIQLSFSPMGKKLQLKNTDKLKGSFTIAGADQVFYPAEVKQVGNMLMVSAKEVSSPAAVRYGWADNPDLTLYNDAGIPGSPFRTDDWTKN